MLAHKFKTSFLVILIAVVALSFGFVAAPAEAVSGIVLEESSGKVEVRTQKISSWEKVSAGRVLHLGDVIRTGHQSKAKIRFESGIVRIYENTIIELPSPTGTFTISDDSIKLRKVLLMKGRSLFEVFKNRLKGEFEVTSPSLVAGVKGTIFRVAEEKGLKGVTVFEGIVQVTNRQHPEESIDLTANHFTVLLENGHLMEAREFRDENIQDTPGEEKGPSSRLQTPRRDTTDEITPDTLNTDASVEIEEADRQLNRDAESFQTRLEERLTDLLEGNRELQGEVINNSIRTDTVLSSPTRTLANTTDSVSDSLVGSTTDTVTGTVSNLTDTVTGTLKTTTETITGLTGSILLP
jgi:hypothetical protein